jgi:hypothetical protein
MLTSLKQLLQVCHAMILCLFCFKSFSKNIKDFLKKFKDFSENSCMFSGVPIWQLVVGMWFRRRLQFIFSSSEEDILFFTLLFFSLLCKRVVLKIS